jgi:hypothetical protein
VWRLASHGAGSGDGLQREKEPRVSDFVGDRECVTHHACGCIQARVRTLEAALYTAADDLYKAANQFGGLMPDGDNRWIFEGKARRAQLQVAPESAQDLELERKPSARQNDSILISSPGSAGLGEDNKP